MHSIEWGLRCAHWLYSLLVYSFLVYSWPPGLQWIARPVVIALVLPLSRTPMPIPMDASIRLAQSLGLSSSDGVTD